MVALPAFKFIFLAIRQMTRPVARQIVSRANVKKGATYKVCICLGRVSLGLTGVISEWNVTEAAKKEAEAKAHEEENFKKNAEVAAKAAAEAAKSVEKTEANAAAGTAPVTPTPTVPVAKEEPKKAEPAPAPPAPPAEKENDKAPALNIVTPRSRPLLTELVYGPIPRPADHEDSCQNIHKRDTYDESVFYDKKRTVGDVARVFIRYPSRSTWDVFRRTFLLPFPEQRLVDAGADFLIELTAYFVLAALLCFELWQQSKSTAAKEAHLQSRLTAIEEKVNELVQLSQEAANSDIAALDPAPELAIGGRLHALWHLAESGVVSVGSLVTLPFAGVGGDGADGKAGGAPPPAANKPLVKKEGKIVPQTNIPKSAMEKPSKHDDTALLKRELESFLQSNGIDDAAIPVRPVKRAKAHEKQAQNE